MIAGLFDLGIRPERAKVEDRRAVGDPDLRVFGVFLARLALPVFGAVGVMESNAGGEFLVMLEIAVSAARPVLAGGRHAP